MDNLDETEGVVAAAFPESQVEQQLTSIEELVV